MGVLALVVLAVAYFFGSRTGKANAAATTADQLSKEIDKNYLSYDLSQYETFAERLYIAVSDPGTDEDAVYNVFTAMRNKSDVLQLIKQFGRRDIIAGIENYTLPEWISSDLSTAEIEKVNQILERNGIDYKF